MPSCLRASLLTCLAIAGCQTAHVSRPLTNDLGSNDAAQQLEFWDRLAEQSVTSNDDAFHGLLMFLDGDDPASDYAGRVRELKHRRMLPQGFDQPADRAVDRGTLAVALLKALNIKGGLILRVFGPSPRYAVRELVFMDLYPPSSPNQTFSGAEFLGIIGKAEDYQRGREASARGRSERETGAPAPEPSDVEPKRPAVQRVSPAGV